MTTSSTQALVAGTIAQARRDLQPDPEGDIEFAFAVLQERLGDAFAATTIPHFDRAAFDAACKS